MAEPVVHDRFNPPGDAGLDCSGDPGKTQQEFKDECDINRILGRMARGQEFPLEKVGSYGDFSDVPTYQGALDLVRYAGEQFAQLPAKVRDRFKNDPAEMMAFVQDPANLREANELGLLKEEKAKALAEEAAVAEARAKVDAADLARFRAGEVKTETLKTT